jgi:hypothetical protein
MSNLYRGPLTHAFYQFPFRQALSEEILKKWPIRNKNRLWWPCLLMDRDKMSIFYRGPSIDASYQVLAHLAKRLQRRRFLEIDQSETRIDCGAMFVNESE